MLSVSGYHHEHIAEPFGQRVIIWPVKLRHANCPCRALPNMHCCAQTRADPHLYEIWLKLQQRLIESRECPLCLALLVRFVASEEVMMVVESASGRCWGGVQRWLNPDKVPCGLIVEHLKTLTGPAKPVQL